jgi:hypothetical protein
MLSTFIAMHQTFQHDLFRLRLNTARACVNALQSCSHPFSANINEPLKMSAQVFITSSVAQLVKKFRAFYGTWRIGVSLPFVLIQSHMDLVHALTSYCCKIHFSIILLSMPESSKWPPSFRFPHQNPVCICLLPLRALPISSLDLMHTITNK